MKTYIISCGDREWNHNTFAGDNFDSAIIFISEHLDINNIEYGERFEDMEYWEDGKLIYTYGSWSGDLCNHKKVMSPSEIKEDIKRHRENVDY